MKKELAKALKYIDSYKYKDLSTVNCYSDSTCKKPVRVFSINGPKAFLLNSLTISTILDKKNPIIKKLIVDLESEANKTQYSYNYFTKEFIKNNTKFKLPDDLDDTALVLSALRNANCAIDDNFIINIIGLEEKEGGPYRTWYTNSEDWKDVDVFVNINLLYFLSLVDIRLAKTEKYIITKIKANLIKSPYYPYELTFYYYAAKYVNKFPDSKLKKYILAFLEKIKFTKLSIGEKLLYLIIQSYLKIEISNNELKTVLDLQKKDGSFPIFPYCYDYYFNNKPSYMASPIISTSLFIELLALNEKENEENNELNSLILKNIKTEIERTPFSKEITKIFSVDEAFKSFAFPLLIIEALNLKVKDIKLVVDLCTASFFGWAGYTLIDKLIDNKNEKFSIVYISTLLRLHYKYTFSLFKSSVLEDLLKAYNSTDNAYYKENTMLNNKNYSKLNYSSVIKRMEALIVFMSYIPGFFSKKLNENDRTELITIIRSILILDQINDDSKDYIEDIKAGIKTPIVQFYKSLKSKDKKDYKISEYSYKLSKNEYKKAQNAINSLKISTDSKLAKLIEKSFKVNEKIYLGLKDN